MLSHRNLVSDFCAMLAADFSFAPGDYHLSYLPLAHVFERALQAGFYYSGAAIGFYQVSDGEPVPCLPLFVDLLRFLVTRSRSRVTLLS